MGGVGDSHFPKIRRNRPARQCSVCEDGARRFPGFIRPGLRILESAGGTLSIDGRGAIGEFDVAGMVARLALEEGERAIDAGAAAAAHQRDFHPWLEIEDVVVHRIPLAIVERAAVGVSQVHLLVPRSRGQIPLILAGAAEQLVQHQGDLQVVGLMIVRFRLGAERIDMIRSRPSLQPSTGFWLVFIAQQVKTPQKRLEPCFVDRLAGGLVQLRPGTNHCPGVVSIFDPTGEPVGQREEKIIVSVLEGAPAGGETRRGLIRDASAMNCLDRSWGQPLGLGGGFHDPFPHSGRKGLSAIRSKYGTRWGPQTWVFLAGCLNPRRKTSRKGPSALLLYLYPDG